MIAENQKELTRKCLDFALEAGASKARASLSKSTMDLVGTLNGEVDKVTSCLDSSISIAIFADGKYGSFSTNRIEENSLKSFIKRAVETVKMLAEDPCRDLADPSRTVKDALTGNELEIYDPEYSKINAEQRISKALSLALKTKEGKGWKVISEESEYSDSEYYNYLVDTNGLEALHSETSFEYWTEITIEGEDGRKYSGSWWEAAPKKAEFKADECGAKALEMAVKQMNPKELASGKYNLVVDRDVASKMVSPVLSALNAFSIQQGNSFLKDSVGKRIFPKGFNIVDYPRIKGQTGSKYFDSEGVATKERPIIEDGIVKEYFVNTYMSNKLGIAPTQEEAIRPKVLPFYNAAARLAPKIHATLPRGTTFNTPAPLKGTLPQVGGSVRGGTAGEASGGVERSETIFGARPSSCEEILSAVGNGILVTEFNGGNSNSATGDFSYGIQGFYFADGKIVHPVSEMLITGNFLQLWSNLLIAGDDARSCMSKLIPTLAFANVDFSG